MYEISDQHAREGILGVLDPRERFTHTDSVKKEYWIPLDGALGPIPIREIFYVGSARQKGKWAGWE